MPAQDIYHDAVVHALTADRWMITHDPLSLSYRCIKTEAIIDAEKDHYEVMHVGWDGVHRVHGCVVHIDIIDEKVWIQYDGTLFSVADALLAAGISREAIVLGFHPPELHHHTDFAVAK